MTARRTCEEVEPDLTAYRLGELDADAEAAITLHLETCEACRTASEEILSTLELLDEAFEEAPAAVEVAAPVPAARERTLSTQPARRARIPLSPVSGRTTSRATSR